MNRYIAGSGYIGCPGRDALAKVWLKNLDANPDFNPEKIIIICSRGDRPPIHCSITDFIVLKGDLGHIWDNVADRKTYTLEGWPAAMLACAMIAYNNESDFIYIEQDCLPFGPFVTKMYEEIGEAGLISGNLSTQPFAQSLFLLKHCFIPEFVHFYLCRKIANRKEQGEQIFEMMEKEMTGRVRRFSFGFDRDRPPGGFESVKDQVFYVQQTSLDEQAKLRELGLLT